jgi:hypothetical protein
MSERKNLKEGYATFLPTEKLGVLSARELANFAVVLETECDEHGNRLFHEIEVVDGPYGGLYIAVPGQGAKEVNAKSAYLVRLINSI